MPIELDSSPSDGSNVHWDEAYWITPKEPRIYPALDPPLAVAERRRLLLELPPAADDLLPPTVLSVSSFLNDWSYCPSPRQSCVPEKVLFAPNSCDTNPHAIVKALKLRPVIPPLSVVLALEKDFGQAWFNGARSIQDTYFDAFHVPFWGMTLWRELAYVYNIRSKWIAVEERIASCKVSV